MYTFIFWWLKYNSSLGTSGQLGRKITSFGEKTLVVNTAPYVDLGTSVAKNIYANYKRPTVCVVTTNSKLLCWGLLYLLFAC